jgi:hypothetical protein
MLRRQNPSIAQLSAEPTSLPDTKYTRIFDLLFFFICLIEYKKYRKSNFKIDDITLASEKSLTKDWLKPEEDEVWEDL